MKPATVIKEEVIFISMEEYNKIKENGGMAISFAQTNEDMQNNTITVYVDTIPS